MSNLSKFLKIKNMWEILISSFGWGELALILIVLSRIVLENQSSQIKLIVQSQVVESIFISLFVSIGVALVKNWIALKKVLIIFSTTIIGAMIAFLLRNIVLWLIPGEIGFSFNDGLLVRIISYMLIILGRSLIIILVCFSGFSLFAGISFSLARIFDPNVILQRFLLPGIIGAAFLLFGVLIIAGLRDWAVLLFLHDVITFVLPITIVTSFLIIAIKDP